MADDLLFDRADLILSEGDHVFLQDVGHRRHHEPGRQKRRDDPPKRDAAGLHRRNLALAETAASRAAFRAAAPLDDEDHFSGSVTRIPAPPPKAARFLADQPSDVQDRVGRRMSVNAERPKPNVEPSSESRYRPEWQAEPSSPARTSALEAEALAQIELAAIGESSTSCAVPETSIRRCS